MSHFLVESDYTNSDNESYKSVDSWLSVVSSSASGRQNKVVAGTPDIGQDDNENVDILINCPIRDLNTKKERQWCFTQFGYNNEMVEKYKNLKNIKYLIFGYEVCRATNREHLQGFIFFENPRCFNGLKKQFPTAHWSPGYRTKNALCRERYCKKDGNFYERGDPPSQGMRTDLEGCHELLKKGGDLKACFDSNFGITCKFYKAFEKYLNLSTLHRKEKPEIYWLWGDTGTGKTRSAVDHSESYYIKDNTKWWDGYSHEEVVIFDDFDGRIPIKDMLRYTDRYPVSGETKFGYTPINSACMYITSDISPTEMYANSPHLLCQLLRRLTSVRHLPDFQSEKMVQQNLLVGTEVHL